MRILSQRHDRSRMRPGVERSMPYTSWRSASMSGHWVRRSAQVRSVRPCGRGRYPSGYSYHS